MAKIVNPKLFSQQFAVPKADIDKAVGLLDPDSAQTEAALSANVTPATTAPPPSTP